MNISILGCGWLGLPLAKSLISKGHVLKGSTTSRDKLHQLTSEGISPYVIQLFEEGIQGDISAFLSDAEVLIIDIPPGVRKDPEVNFVGKIGRLSSQIERSGVKKVIFISATSVYEDMDSLPVYSEEDLANGTAENSKQLKGAEEILKNSEAFETSIIRFGGLIGPGRHPVNYLSGKIDLKDAEGPVNLIHLEDCIGIIEATIEKEAWPYTFNAVAPDHPTRKDYYSKIAEEKGLASMTFDNNLVSKGKVISSKELQKKLRYEFLHDIWH
tara:strand:- start:54708 stop:55517 length:810 start_codon:yes stop_codon:yes gene_type:complete